MPGPFSSLLGFSKVNTGDLETKLVRSRFEPLTYGIFLNSEQIDLQSLSISGKALRNHSNIEWDFERVLTGIDSIFG